MFLMELMRNCLSIKPREGGKVTKEQLEQLISLRAEIKELNREIKRLRERNREIVTDKVQASSHEFPYTQVNMVIRGYDVKGARKRNAAIHKKQCLLEKRMVEAQLLEADIAEFINTIHNSEIRRIFHARYELGWTWEQIGNDMHCDRTTVEKKISKYLRECKSKF